MEEKKDEPLIHISGYATGLRVGLTYFKNYVTINEHSN